MNKLLFPCLITVLLSFGTTVSKAQITVGVIQNGVPILTKTDAQLTSEFAFITRNATLTGSSIQMGTDSLGIYYYIKTTGARTGVSNDINIAIILEASGTNLVFEGSGCTMESIPGLPCTKCDQVIYERCKRQSCSCKSEIGGCTASITFPNQGLCQTVWAGIYRKIKNKKALLR